MTATILQEQLCEEIRSIFQQSRFKDSTGKHVELNVFEQNLPIREDDEEPDPVPYVIVRMSEGTTKSDEESHEVIVELLIGYFDDNPQNNGHKGVLEIIQKIYERFAKNPMLANRFIFKEPFEWAMQDEESFPYYFGAASMTFTTAAIRKEDPLA